ncbi:MAG: CRISPR-associated protein Cas4 [Candidatus Accumulibacter sp.]|nr:CRISPR-associated protein Cas4 [Accumulibacter sp.]MBL8393410.1 CRISPR-associated protein Cas4 [Accumulibacter sp.]
MTFACDPSHRALPVTDCIDPIPIAALQHWSYCPRQCALIHQEQAFADNVHTARGQVVHAQVDSPGFSTQGNVRSVRALPLYSDRLGLVGKADIVEFLPDGTPCPVEYKHGPRWQHEHDDIQVAAQALCLEEMTGKPVRRGAVYHASSHRRRELAIADELRETVMLTIAAVRSMLDSSRLPLPVNDSRCRECSLQHICQPVATAAADRLARLRQELFQSDECNR